MTRSGRSCSPSLTSHLSQCESILLLWAADVLGGLHLEYKTLVINCADINAALLALVSRARHPDWWVWLATPTGRLASETMLAFNNIMYAYVMVVRHEFRWYRLHS